MAENQTYGIDDWRIVLDSNPAYSYADRHAGSAYTRVDSDEEYIAVEASLGSGFSQINTTSSIPLTVLFKLLAQQGYRITRDET